MRALLIAPLALAAAVALGGAAPYSPPPETAALPDAPGVAQARIYCVACHSVDYITTQPQGMPSPFWEASVTKMIRIYGAPIPEAQVKPLAEYLAAATVAKPAPTR